MIWLLTSSQTFFANVSTFAALDIAGKTGPVFELEYSTRTAYDPNNTWPSDAPLNASFFHRVTENVSSQPSHLLFQRHLESDVFSDSLLRWRTIIPSSSFSSLTRGRVLRRPLRFSPATPLSVSRLRSASKLCSLTVRSSTSRVVAETSLFPFLFPA